MGVYLDGVNISGINNVVLAFWVKILLYTILEQVNIPRTDSLIIKWPGESCNNNY